MVGKRRSIFEMINRQQIKQSKTQPDRERLNPYLVQKILSASPEQLILYIYEAAITACARKNQPKAAEAIQQLINALNFKERTVANTFYQMYQNILELIHNKKFDAAKRLLTEIRNTWAKAMKLE